MRHIAGLAAAAAAVPFLLLAFSSGPDPGHSGAPGERTCAAAGCHTGTAVNGGPGSVRITTAGANYTPGQRQRVTVTVSDPNQRRWGFQLTARSGADFRTQAGSFTPGADRFTQEICSDQNFRELPGCPASTVYRYIQHTTSGTRGGTTGSVTYEFEWTPPASNAGPVRLYVAANAANGDGSISGDRIYTATADLTPAASGPRPAISSGGVLNGASFAPPISPNSWITITGTNLAATERVNRADEIVNGRRPTSMDGVSVTVNGKPGYFFFVSPGQLNLVSPDDDAVGPVPVVVTVNGQASEPATVQLARYSPAFFLWPGKQVVATSQNFEWRVKNGTFPGASTIPAAPGEVIILWGTGFGPTDPVVPAGQVVTGAPLVRTPIRVRVGGVQAEYFATALAPGFTALYQVAIRIPDVPNGDHAVVAEIDGVSSPADAVIAVQRR